jgi:uncharacterized protein (DUF433 family)
LVCDNRVAPPRSVILIAALDGRIDAEKGSLEMATRPTTFSHITRVPGVVGGEPVVKGTRVPVRSIVIIHRLYGSIDRVLAAFPRVSRTAAEEALAYYDEHRDEIDRWIADNEEPGAG